MTASVALCADMTSLRHPEAIGLAGENLAAQEWLRLFSTGEEARRFLCADQAVDEVWVASSDDIEPINLAASLKRDRADRRVCLLSFDGTGSLMSRANAAGIDASLSRQAFLDRYVQRKRQHAAAAGGARFEAQGAPAPCAPAAPVVQPERPRVAVAYRGAPAAASLTREAPCAATARGESSAFLMPVVSGSGGAGKSTVAALAALTAQALGFKTLLLDFDLQFGDMAHMMGMQGALSVDELLAVPARIESLAPDGRMPALLAAPKRLEDAERVVEQASELLDRLARRFEVIVANTGAAWAEQHAVLLERSTKALFLVDQRASSLRACRHALDLCARCGIATGPFSYAVNWCAKNALFTSIDVSCALGGAHVFELADGGGEVEEMLGAGQPLDLMESRNALCLSVEELLRESLPNAAGRPAWDGAPSRRRPGLRLLKSGKPRKRGREEQCL
ncbi:AAA family ATPase [Arabiibacter massiliensis]|uniref:AAA family ATPase n=1 Tax=Arabiibacter massiliensis TaxID=1870985 RepID=UPI0009B9A185|nr:P-loop NTPase [Arabiibacter massiliensis]